MARVSRAARTVHRVLSYVVFAQLTVWILGGFVIPEEFFRPKRPFWTGNTVQNIALEAM